MASLRCPAFAFQRKIGEGWKTEKRQGFGEEGGGVGHGGATKDKRQKGG